MKYFNKTLYIKLFIAFGLYIRIVLFIACRW